MMAMPHPFHAHAIQWQILDRQLPGDTTPTPASGIDLGWKDTFLVHPGEVVRIIGQFDSSTVGNYMYHCHILEHEDNGMMGIFSVSP
jgi:FtsP/CotA-like multicopper oxidase with cupredoxin domain